LAEALYVTLYYHSAVRLAPFVEMITHSATVNHGGGLRKERERVYANPCHYARTLFSRFAGALPVESELATPFYVTPLVLTELMATGFGSEVPILDAVTAVDRDGRLLISVVNRSGREALDLEVELEGFQEAGRESGKAALTTISGDLPWSSNSLREPEAVKPETVEVKVEDGKLRLAVPRHSVVQVEISL
jgi:alpha-N-arabinofuranosidase